MVDFGLIPLIAMSPRARNIFSASLNPPKVLQTCDKRFRDWRGFAGILDIGGEANPLITSSPDPTGAIIDILKTREKKVTFKELLKALEMIDRWDIVDDATDILEKDGRDYLERLEKGNAPVINISVDNQMLTYDDQIRYEAGQSMQTYDAFLLYADEDASFADEVIEKLEKKGNLRLCTRDRDLISRGERFESDVLMQLIAERCTRLVAVFSPNFIKIPVNTFLMSYGQSIGLHECRRKIVPVIYQQCNLPKQMFTTVLLRYEQGKNSHFWDRLKNCIRTVTPPAITPDGIIVENSSVEPEASPAEPEASPVEPEASPVEPEASPVEPEAPPAEPEAPPEKKEEDPEINEIETPEGNIEVAGRKNSLESSSKRAKKNGFFRFSIKKCVKQNDDIVQLPTLSGLDDLEKSEGDNKEEKGRNKGVADRIKALVSRS